MTLSVGPHTDCLELVSGEFRIAVTTKVGPRVIGGFVKGSENIFQLMPDQDLPGIETGFRLYGGHRLWQSPEANPRSYAPDNAPVEVREEENGVRFTAEVEAVSGLQKSMLIEPLGSERFRVVHRLVNHNEWRIELAPWALSVMAKGGFAVIPQHRDVTANPFASDRGLMLWPYTELNDERLILGRDYIFLKQDVNAAGRCKIGFNAEPGWIAYLNKKVAFVKSFDHFIDALYPDNGCSVESFSCPDFCEIETLGPLYELEPGEQAEHIEIWTGLADVNAECSEQSIADNLVPRLPT